MFELSKSHLHVKTDWDVQRPGEKSIRTHDLWHSHVVYPVKLIPHL